MNKVFLSTIHKYFPAAKIKNTSRVFPHTEIIHFSQKGSKFVAKLIEHQVLSTYSLQKRRRAIRSLYKTTNAYYHLLKKEGIPVPPHHELVIEKNQLIEFATDLGNKRLDAILQKASIKERQNLTTKYITEILPILGQEKYHVGFDASAENFFWFKGRFTFCDFVPARMKYQGAYLVGFPQPTKRKEIQKGYERYYLPYGILRRARIFFLSIHPQLDQIFFSALQKKLSKSAFQRLQNQFQASDEFIVKKYIKLKQWPRALKTIESISDTDTLREIAILVFWLIKEQTIPTEVYDLSRLHTHFSQRQKEKRFTTFKKSITNIITSIL